MNTKTLSIITLVLAVVAIVLGIRLYSTGGTVGSHGGSSKVAALPTPGSGYVLSASDRAKLLATPNASSTPEQKRDFVVFAAAKSVTTRTIDISSCTPSPIVAAVKKGSTLALVNTDPVQRTFLLNKSFKFTVAAQSAVFTQVNFASSTGLYSYGCDQSRTPVGFILVTN